MHERYLRSPVAAALPPSDSAPSKDPLHDLSNVVGSVMLSVQSLLLERGLDPELRAELELILGRTKDGKKLIERLRERERGTPAFS